MFDPADVANAENETNSSTSPNEEFDSMEDISDLEIPSGFTKGYEAEKILGANDMNNQIWFLIKW